MSEGLLTGLGVAGLVAGTGLAGWGLLGRKALATTARWCIGSGGYLLLLVLVARGLQVRGWPLSSAYEAALLVAAAAALLYAFAVPRWLTAPGGVCAGAGALLVFLLATLLFPAGARVAHPPPAALAGVWFPLHAGTTALGYGGLILAGSAGLLLLLRGGGTGTASSRPALLAPAELGALARRGLAWGYPLLTLGMTFGAIWGWTTWGRYWTWSVKEVLTLLAWGLFTAALHARRLSGWRGRPHAALLAAGLAAVLAALFAAQALVRWLGPAVQYVF